MQKPPGRVFYPQMESLRGIAALTVVLFHVSQSVGGVSAHLQDVVGIWFAIFIFTTQTIFNGSSAVILFFVLSGFVLGLNAEPDLSVRSYAAFIVRRIFRLLPLGVVAVMFSVIVWRLFSSQSLSPRDILENALLLHTKIDGPLWSLRVEVILSLAFPLLFFCLTRPGPAVRLTAFLTIFFATLAGYTARLGAAHQRPSGPAGVHHLGHPAPRQGRARPAPRARRAVSFADAHLQGRAQRRRRRRRGSGAERDRESLPLRCRFCV